MVMAATTPRGTTLNARISADHCVADYLREPECSTKIPAVLDQWPIVGRDQEIGAIMRSIAG